MPPHSTSLQQEGAVFTSFKLVTGGVFQEKGKGEDTKNEFGEEDESVLFILSLLPAGFLLLFACICISAVTEALMAPAQYPDCSGTRNLHDNLSDLRAQVAANQRGSQLVGELIDSYGLSVVQAYMGYIQVPTQWNTVKEKQRYLCSATAFMLMFQSNAELAVRDMLRDFARRRCKETGSLEVESEDFMDDGTAIRLRVQINQEEVSKARTRM